SAEMALLPPVRKSVPAAKYSMINHQKDYRANNSDKQVHQIKAAFSNYSEHFTESKEVEDPTPDDRADNSQQDIAQHAFASAVNNFTGNKTSNQSQHYPGYHRHC